MQTSNTYLCDVHVLSVNVAIQAKIKIQPCSHFLCSLLPNLAVFLIAGCYIAGLLFYLVRNVILLEIDNPLTKQLLEIIYTNDRHIVYSVDIGGLSALAISLARLQLCQKKLMFSHNNRVNVKMYKLLFCELLRLSTHLHLDSVYPEHANQSKISHFN